MGIGTSRHGVQVTVTILVFSGAGHLCGQVALWGDRAEGRNGNYGVNSLRLNPV